METISKMSESWIVDDAFTSSDGSDLSAWEIIDGPDLSLSSDDETLDFPSLDFPNLLSQSPPKKKPPVLLLDRFGCNYYNGCHMEGDDDDMDDDCDDVEGGDEVDDELVPKGFRLERNRMRKLGKREYSKMAKSKKLPSVYNRPGCVRGKHGLGLKHSLM